MEIALEDIYKSSSDKFTKFISDSSADLFETSQELEELKKDFLKEKLLNDTLVRDVNLN